MDAPPESGEDVATFAHIALAPLGAEVTRLLTPPTPEALERIRAQCGTITTP